MITNKFIASMRACACRFPTPIVQVCSEYHRK